MEANKNTNWARTMKKLISLLCCILLIPSANGAIISGDLVTGGGKNVDLGGLEWLSFDHVDSDTGLDYSTGGGLLLSAIEDSTSIWSQAGWQIANVTQVDNLFSSLGFITTPGIFDGLSASNSPANNDGLNFLFDNWGSETAVGFDGIVPDSNGNEFRLTISEYRYAEVIYGEATNLERPRFRANTEYTRGIDYIDDALADSEVTFLDRILLDWQRPLLTRTGVFLVREESSSESDLSVVPIPAAAWLFGTALIGMAGFSKRRKQHG